MFRKSKCLGATWFGRWTFFKGGDGLLTGESSKNSVHAISLFALFEAQAPLTSSRFLLWLYKGWEAPPSGLRSELIRLVQRCGAPSSQEVAPDATAIQLRIASTSAARRLSLHSLVTLATLVLPAVRPVGVALPPAVWSTVLVASSVGSGGPNLSVIVRPMCPTLLGPGRGGPVPPSRAAHGGEARAKWPRKATSA